MHPDEERLQRLRHGELAPAEEVALRAHLERCDECRARVAQATREEHEVYALLGKVDHPAPWVDAVKLISEARTSEPRRWRWAAGVLLAFGVAGAAYAVPGSPVRAWVAAVIERAQGRPAPPATPTAPANDAGMAGVALAPGEALVIVFTAPDSASRVRVSLTDESAVVVRAPRRAATFTSDVDRLTIDNRGATATFEIEIPRAAPRVEIRVGGARLFLKQGPRVTAAAPPAGPGLYFLPLAPAEP